MANKIIIGCNANTTLGVAQNLFENAFLGKFVIPSNQNNNLEDQLKIQCTVTTCGPARQTTTTKDMTRSQGTVLPKRTIK
jgi:hypothetical protein